MVALTAEDGQGDLQMIVPLMLMVGALIGGLAGAALAPLLCILLWATDRLDKAPVVYAVVAAVVSYQVMLLISSDLHIAAAIAVAGISSAWCAVLAFTFVDSSTLGR